MDLQEHLIALCNAPGVSGYEHPVREQIAAAWEPLADSLSVDALGNLIAAVEGRGPAPRPRILITAHMDEIGLMVTGFQDGFVRFTEVGGIDVRVLPGQPVIIHGTEPTPGIVASRPPHVLSAADRKRHLPLTRLLIDTGLPPREVARRVQVGDVITFDQPAIALNNGLVTGKALDNRASVACLTRLLELLRHRTQAWDVRVAATVQEEVGLKGGATAAWGLAPDLAIVVDTTWGLGVGVAEDKGFKLGDGPTLMIGPDAHPGLFHAIRQTAGDLDIRITPEVAPGASGTEAHAVHLSRDGIPTAILSIPIRNMHTPVEIAAVKDIERTARLIAGYIATLDDGTLDALSADEPAPA